MYARIVVALDSSDESSASIPHVTFLAKALRIPVHAVQIVDYAASGAVPVDGMAMDYSAMDEITELEESDAKSNIRSMIDRLKSEGLEVSGEVATGDIVDQFSSITNPDDLLVMATHGRTGIRRFLLGSVSEEVARSVNCAVLLVHVPKVGGNE